MARTPPRGPRVISRNWVRARRRSAGTSRVRSRIRCRTMRISVNAKLAPRHRRVPPPNGSHVVGVGSVGSKEALRSEATRLGIEVGATMDRTDRGIDLHSGRDRERAKRERLLPHDAPDARDHRPEAQRLLDDCIEVAWVALLCPLHDPAIVQQQVERPGKPCGGCLVSGKQECEQLVAHLAVAETLLARVTGEQQGREHVVSPCQRRIGTTAVISA